MIGYRRTSICLVFCSSFHNFYSQCSKQMIPGLLRLANFLWRSQSPISVCCLAGFIAHCRLIFNFFAGNRETLSVSSYRGGIGTLSTDFLVVIYCIPALAVQKRSLTAVIFSKKANISQGLHTKRSLYHSLCFSASFDQSFSISKLSFFLKNSIILKAMDPCWRNIHYLNPSD